MSEINPNYPNDCVLFDVGLKGNEEKLLVNSYAIFSGLKFKTTSYNHEGAPFYLVITLYLGSLNEAQAAGLGSGSDEENKQDGQLDQNENDKEQINTSTIASQPRVLLSKISPPLYINSRKLAKESSTKVNIFQ